MKFSIRDLFLVTVIVAVVLGWWVDHRSQAAWRCEAKASLDRMEAKFLKLGFGIIKGKRGIPSVVERKHPTP
jgi:hypothetical protein